MKKFSFRLDHLLRLREQEEELWKLKLGQASRRVDEIDLGISRTRREESSALAGVGNPVTMYQAQLFILRMQQERTRLETERIGAEKKRLEVLADYARARQKAEVLRKHRAKRHDEWRKSMIEYQDAQTDDMVGARLFRQHGGTSMAVGR